MVPAYRYMEIQIANIAARHLRPGCGHQSAITNAGHGGSIGCRGHRDLRDRARLRRQDVGTGNGMLRYLHVPGVGYSVPRVVGAGKFTCGLDQSLSLPTRCAVLSWSSVFPGMNFMSLFYKCHRSRRQIIEQFRVQTRLVLEYLPTPRLLLSP